MSDTNEHLKTIWIDGNEFSSNDAALLVLLARSFVKVAKTESVEPEPLPTKEAKPLMERTCLVCNKKFKSVVRQNMCTSCRWSGKKLPKKVTEKV